MSANTGGPASEKTLRDEFAGQAMLAITISALSENTRTCYSIGNPRFLECLSVDAYAHAEAMLAERARREAVVQESSTTDNAAKVADLQEANRELVEALEWFVESCGETNGIPMFQVAAYHNAKAVLAKHKGAK